MYFKVHMLWKLADLQLSRLLSSGKWCHPSSDENVDSKFLWDADKFLTDYMAANLRRQ